MSAVKEELIRLGKELPEDATWEDAMDALYLQTVIAQGLKELSEGKLRTTQEVRKSLGLPA